MNRIGTRCLLIAAALLVTVSVRATLDETNATENAYRAIIDRNPFNLKPPPPATPPAAPAEPAKKGDLKLTGITSFGKRKAYFMMLEQKQGAVPEYYALGVDEKRDGLEVIDIDDVSKAVRVRYDGGEMLMTFATHGVQGPAATTNPGQAKPPGAPGAPGANPATVTATPNPTYTTAYNMAATPGTAPAQGAMAFGTIPSRPTRTTTGGMAMDPVLAERYGLRSMPSNVPSPAAQPNGDTAEQVIMLELQRQANPTMNLPPTPGLPGTTQMGGPAPPLPGSPRVR